MKKILGQSPITSIAGYVLAVLLVIQELQVKGETNRWHYLTAIGVAIFGRLASDTNKTNRPLVMILLFAPLLITSCARKVFKESSETIKTATTGVSIVDTSKQYSHQTTSTVIRYGDTLKGSLYFGYDQFQPLAAPDSTTVIPATEPVVVDSIESAGLKIKVGILPQKGGIKVQLSAVAKPIETLNKQENTAINITNKHYARDSTGTDASKEASKNTETVNWGFILTPLSIIVAALVALIYLTKKPKQSGKE